MSSTGIALTAASAVGAHPGATTDCPGKGLMEGASEAPCKGPPLAKTTYHQSRDGQRVWVCVLSISYPTELHCDNANAMLL